VKAGIVDLDPQGSAAVWAKLRDPSRPMATVVEARPGALSEALASLAADGTQMAFIDVPPHSDAALAGAVGAADAVVMPSLPSAFDIHSLASFLPLVTSSGKPSGVVLNGVVPNTIAVPEAEAVLASMGLRLLAKVSRRMAHQYAAAKGLSPCELEPKGPAAKEIEAVMAAVVEMLEGGE
jgi:chromosome partitioning protein